MPHRAPHQLERDAEAAARRNELQRSFGPQRPSGPWPVPLTAPRPWTVWGYIGVMVLLSILYIAHSGRAVLIGQILISALLWYLFFTGSKIAWGLSLIGGFLVVLSTASELFDPPLEGRSTRQTIYLTLHILGLVLLLLPATRRWFERSRRDGP